MQRAKTKVTIQLPEEFVELCNYDMVCPALVLRGFVADLCGIISWASNPRADQYTSNGSDEREFARQYYNRVGYPYEAQWLRDSVGQAMSPCSKAANSNCRCRTKELAPKLTDSIGRFDPADAENISKIDPKEQPVHR